jgi:hypothetical protein
MLYRSRPALYWTAVVKNVYLRLLRSLTFEPDYEETLPEQTPNDIVTNLRLYIPGTKRPTPLICKVAVFGF